MTPSKFHSQGALCPAKTHHITVRQLAYESRISKRQEHVPVIATFAGAKGMFPCFATDAPCYGFTDVVSRMKAAM